MDEEGEVEAQKAKTFIFGKLGGNENGSRILAETGSFIHLSVFVNFLNFFQNYTKSSRRSFHVIEKKFNFLYKANDSHLMFSE